jgi:hypothetical protein
MRFGFKVLKTASTQMQIPRWRNWTQMENRGHLTYAIGKAAAGKIFLYSQTITVCHGALKTAQNSCR